MPTHDIIDKKFEDTISIPQGTAKIGRSTQLAHDVVLFYAQQFCHVRHLHN
jgi:hypothetical protein